MDKVDLNLLPIALALYDERSVSRAAQRLGMSQPAVSMALRRLRGSFNDQLFVRAAAGVSPTPRAHALIEVARPLVTQLYERLLADDAFDPATTTRTFTFALSDVGEMVFLPRLLERLRANAPHATIRSVAIAPEQTAAGLESGQVDLAIGHFPDLRRQSYFQQRLFTHHFACLIRAAHPLRAPRLALDAFLGAEHAVVHSGGRSQEIFERFLARKRLRRKVALLTPHFLSLPMIIARSDLISTVPHAVALHFARISPELAIAQLPFTVAGFDLKQHWHRKYHHDARNRWLRAQVAELFNDESDEWKVGWKVSRRSRGSRESR